MGFPRFLQLVGLVTVTYVMVRSYMVDSMTFQFGGLAIGAGIFVVGKLIEK